MDPKQSSVLLRGARQGSAEALDCLFRRYGGKLLGLIRLRLGYSLRAHLESRDILQASLLKAFQRIDQLESSDTGSFMAWLARIAENEIRDQVDYYHRQRRDAARQVPLDPLENGGNEIAAQLRSEVSRMVRNQELERLERAIESLDETYREVILLRKFEELSFKDIGRRLGRSADASRMLLARALTALTLKMGETS